MNIEVIGGGALGLLFAAAAAEGGARTVLYTRTEEQARLVASEGIEVRQAENETPKRIGGPALSAAPIRDFSARTGRAGWVVLAVKQKDLDDALVSALQAGMRPGDRLFCLQNGVGHIERLGRALPGIAVYAAITTEGARRSGPAAVLRAGRGTTLFGLPGDMEAPSPTRIFEEKKLASAFEKAGLSLSASNEIETVMYRKLLINAVINPLTAVWATENGGLLRDGARLRLMRALFDEIMRVYAAAGIRSSESWWDDLLDVCEATARNRSSMLEDVSRGRGTEARWISGGIVELARRSGADAPLNRTMLDLIEGMAE